jgi:hypothetical protein
VRLLINVEYNCHFPASGYKCTTRCQVLRFPVMVQVSRHKNNKINLPAVLAGSQQVTDEFSFIIERTVHCVNGIQCVSAKDLDCSKL